MKQFIPITLSGNTLGERHRQLNSLVNDAYTSSIPFKSIQDAPETSPIDRLFKIDLASKHKDVDYIVENLKDNDMLYVSRALKCTWLLDPHYNSLVNADYLENELFPDMTTPAINKTKHWIQDHLQDPERCRLFFEYYKESDFQFAMKFLRHCSNEYLLEEFDSIKTSIEPKQLKVLSEKCPQLTKIFYEQIKHNKDLLKHYLDHEKYFLQNLKYLLKSDPDTFFEILEKYYDIRGNSPFRSDITRHIMVNHKNKFLKKPELYTVHLLDMSTLAKCLSPEEAKDLVVKLAHASYLAHWFTYKTVEPLILRLDKDARVALKKIIFVDKDLGVKITEWPYNLPTSPVLKKKPGYSLFADKVRNPWDYDAYMESDFRLFCKKKKLKCKRLVKKRYRKEKTLLDELFDHYRFASFESTFSELRMRLRSESSLQNRQFMMLVLVSKCGGRENNVRTLFGLLVQYKNEPVHLRAAIIRSLVKRAFAWRLPEDLWNNLLEWGYGLGLDGSQPEAACDEGLHAIVLRDLLANETLKPVVLNAFVNHFSNFTEYSLITVERYCVRTSLPNLLMVAADKEKEPKKLKLFNQVLDTLQAYKLNLNVFPSIITAIGTAAQEDLERYKDILKRLFIARAGRKQLFKVNFSQIQNNASYVNVLRHDTTVLDAKKFIDLHAATVDTRKYFRKRRLKYDQFLRKLVIYFSEDGGLAKEFYAVLKLEAESKPHKLLARPLVLLSGKDLTTLLKTFDCDTHRRSKTASQSLAAALRANMHVARPSLDLDDISWEAAGVKAVANMVSISPNNKREEMIGKLAKWKRALRLALALTVDDDTKYTIFKSLVTSRPGSALKAFLKYLKGDTFGDFFLAIWNEVKPLITTLDYKNRDRLFNNLANISIPEPIKSEYYMLVFKVYKNIDEKKALPILCKLENICCEVDETFLYEVLKTFLEKDFKLELVLEDDCDIYNFIKCSLYIRMIAKFLLLCRSEEIQKERLDVVGSFFFVRFEDMWMDPTNRKHLVKFLFKFLFALKYNRVIFDVNYVSCVPVFERIILWIQSMLPIEKWFDGYVNVQLTILYHRAARYCLENKPEYYITDSTNLDKGVEMFGTIFGKMVAQEFEELESKYFQSIKEIYKKELMNYFVICLDYQNYDESKEKFAIAFVKSVLIEGKTEESHLIAFHIFYEHVKFYFEYNFDLSEIINLLKDNNNNELRFNFEIMIANDSKRCDKIRCFDVASD